MSGEGNGEAWGDGRTCSTMLEKRGPMRTYSRRRSRSSSMMSDKGDLCASSNMRAMC